MSAPDQDDASAPAGDLATWASGERRRWSIDVATAEVVAALGAAGIRCVLLKGPSVSRWLYARAEQRSYGDSDLLVPLEDVEAAQDVLQALDYECLSFYDVEADPIEEVDVHESKWQRQHDAHITELHWTLVGLQAPPADVWRELTADTESLVVGGVVVRVLAPAARAMQLALHLAQHGVGPAHPVEDLRRAIARLELPTWRAARDMAARLGGLDAFGAGLRACGESGARLTVELDLPASTAYWTLRAQRSPRGATRLAYLLVARGSRDRWVIGRAGLRHYREYLAASATTRRATFAAAVRTGLRALRTAWRSRGTAGPR